MPAMADKVECPHCRELINAEATLCRSCRMDLVLNVPVDVVTWQDDRKRTLVPLKSLVKSLAIIPLIAIGRLGGVGMGELLVVFLAGLLLWWAANRRPRAE